METPQVQIVRVNEPDELYCRYPSECQRQEVYLFLDLETGRLSCSYDPNVGGGQSQREFDGLVRSWVIPPLTADSANQFMTDIKEVAQKILDNSWTEWDNQRGRDRGWLNRDGIDAYDKLYDLCEQVICGPYDSVNEMSADDWFTPEGTKNVIERLGLTADTSDEDIARFASEEEAEARQCQGGYITILDGAERWLLSVRDDLRNEREEK